MREELRKELELFDKSNLNIIEHTQNCIAIYEQTLKAMGVLPQSNISQAVDNSQLVYINPPKDEGQYANITENY